MKARFIAFLVLILVSVSILTLASCSSGTDLEKTRVGKADQKATVTFPEKKFIDDREARFAVRIVTYPKALPTLSAKVEGFTVDDITGWFTAGGGKAQPKIEILPHTPDLSLSGVHGEQLSNAKPIQKMWEITGEETGTLSLTNESAITFANPNEYRSYGVLPKGNLRKDVKIVFARDMIEEKDAVEGVEAYIESHGGIPESAKRKITPGQSNIRIVKGGKLIDPIGKTLWYSVNYEHRYEGIPIELDKI